jgi:hypothetical protein
MAELRTFSFPTSPASSPIIVSFSIVNSFTFSGRPGSEPGSAVA